MTRVYYFNAEELAYDLVECAECRSDDGGSAVVGSYDTVIDLANIILKNTDYVLDFCEIGPPELDGYDDAFIMSLYDDSIAIEKAYNDVSERYFCMDSGKTFVEQYYLDEYLESNDPDDNIVIFTVDESFPIYECPLCKGKEE